MKKHNTEPNNQELPDKKTSWFKRLWQKIWTKFKSYSLKKKIIIIAALLLFSYISSINADERAELAAIEQQAIKEEKEQKREEERKERERKKEEERKKAEEAKKQEEQDEINERIHRYDDYTDEQKVINITQRHIGRERVTTRKDPDSNNYLVEVDARGQTPNMMFKSSYHNLFAVLEDMKYYEVKFDNIFIDYQAPLQDAYGNSEYSSVMQYNFTGDTVSKINFNNLLPKGLPPIADFIWIHDAVLKDIKIQ